MHAITNRYKYMNLNEYEDEHKYDMYTYMHISNNMKISI